jgi:HAD superfamily hydrolase (TIGR01549 family)
MCSYGSSASRAASRSTRSRNNSSSWHGSESLASLERAGYFVGIAGNRTARAGRLLRDLNLDADLIATSDDWGAEKPTAAFFDKLIRSVGLHPAQVAYVGDRVDNDIRPARAVRPRL